MQRKLFIPLVLLLIAYMGCKQSLYKAPGPAPSSSYLPQTNGTSWVYRDSTYGVNTDPAAIYGVHYDTLSYIMNGATTDFNGMICYDARVVAHNTTIQTDDYYVARHIYQVIETTAPFGLTTLQVLNDTASVGYTWVSNPSITGLMHNDPVRSVNTIAEKGIAKVVNGKTFNNVIHTSINYQINVNNSGFVNIGHFDVFMAPGVGIIEKDSNYYGYLNEDETLLSSKIM